MAERRTQEIAPPSRPAKGERIALRASREERELMAKASDLHRAL